MSPRSTRPTAAGRRFGYVVAVLVNLALMFAANRWPGWEQVPFLTGDTEKVMPLVNASIVAGIVANLTYLVRDPPWWKALGDAVTTTVGLVAVIRVWAVFPFDFAESRVDWSLLTRVLLVVAMVGSAVGIVAALVRFVRSLVGGAEDS